MFLYKLIYRYGELTSMETSDGYEEESSQAVEMKANVVIQRPSDYCTRYIIIATYRLGLIINKTTHCKKIN